MKTKSLEQWVQVICGLIMAVCCAILAVKCIFSLDLFVATFFGLSAYAGYVITRLSWEEMRYE